MKSALAFAAGIGLAWLLPRAGTAGASASAAIGKNAGSESANPQSDGGAAASGGAVTFSGWQMPAAPSLERRLRDLLELKDKEKTDALSKWPLEDIQRAWRWLMQRWDEDEYNGSLAHCLIRAWTAVDQPGALAAALAYPSRDGRGYLIGITLAEALADDPDKTTAFIETLKGRADRHEMIQAALSVWAKEDIEAAMSFAMSSDLLSGSFYDIMSVARSSQESLDPDLLFTAALKMKDRMARAMLMEMAADKMSESDPAGAWQRLLASEQSPEVTCLLAESLFSNWAEKAHQEAVEAIAGIESPSLQAHLSRSVLRNAPDGKQAVEAANAMGSSIDRGMMSERIGDRFDQKLDINSIRETASLFADPAEQSRFLASVIDNHVNQEERAKITELVNEIPDDAVRDRSVMTLAHSWADADAKGAEAWMRQIPPSTERDWALTGIISSKAKIDARAATNLLPLFQDAGAKTAAMMTIAAKWLKDDAAAANQWMSNQPLTAGQKALIAEAARDGSSDGAFKPDGGWTGKP